MPPPLYADNGGKGHGTLHNTNQRDDNYLTAKDRSNLSTLTRQVHVSMGPPRPPLRVHVLNIRSCPGRDQHDSQIPFGELKGEIPHETNHCALHTDTHL